MPTPEPQSRTGPLIAHKHPALRLTAQTRTPAPQNNTYGTHVLLEAARKAGTIRRFINVSTDEVG